MLLTDSQFYALLFILPFNAGWFVVKSIQKDPNRYPHFPTSLPADPLAHPHPAPCTPCPTNSLHSPLAAGFLPTSSPPIRTHHWSPVRPFRRDFLEYIPPVLETASSNTRFCILMIVYMLLSISIIVTSKVVPFSSTLVFLFLNNRVLLHIPNRLSISTWGINDRIIINRC